MESVADNTDHAADHVVELRAAAQHADVNIAVTPSCGLRELVPVRPSMTAFTRGVRSAFDTLIVMSESDSIRVDQGSAGFEELRKYVKQGGDDCKDVSCILQERSELEALYAKGLGKLSVKTAKVAKESIGSLAQAYQAVSAELEAEGELHKTFAIALVEEIIKPLRLSIEAQHKSRKAVELAVDKLAKSLHDLRLTEFKAKKNCYVCAKDNERMQAQLLDARVLRGKILSDKETAKLESKRRKTEDSAKRADFEYYTVCVSAERSRLEWETSVVKGCSELQTVEEERLSHMNVALQKYSNCRADLGPKMIQSGDRLAEAINGIDVASDIQTVIAQKGTSQCVSEQMLPDFYAEDTSNAMQKDRRREALERLVAIVRRDVDRERRGKAGVENLARCFHETPTFGDDDAQRDVQEKLQHMRAMLAYLEATRHKLHCCLADLEGRSRPVHPLGRHLEQHKDKQGQVQSILKVPSWVKHPQAQQSQSWDVDAVESNSILEKRGSADGTCSTSHSPENCDEFSVSSQESSTCSAGTRVSHLKRHLSLCKAVYDYEANLYDELTIHPGDVITVYEKQSDGWWHGELNGVVGIFPATYVEELN